MKFEKVSLIPFLMALVTSCGTSHNESQLADWTLDETYYYRVHSESNVKMISQGKCQSEQSGLVDISFEGCQTDLVKKDYQTFKNWLAAKVDEDLASLGQSQKDANARTS